MVNGQKFDFHILPSGLLAPKTVNLIGNGTVFHVPQFFKELKSVQEKGVHTDGRIFVSDRAHVLFDLHRLADSLSELGLGTARIGTTGNGIGPCYGDKALRRGIRVAQIFDKQTFDDQLRKLARRYADQYREHWTYDVEKEIREFDAYRESLKPHVMDSIELVCKAQDEGQEMLVEAANALCLDIDGGTYPFVTSSSAGIAGVYSGLLGIRPESIQTRIGVVKAYTTRVGSGPLPTEDMSAIGDKLQSVGREFGTTTGRRRRCGNLDLVLLRHTTAINRYTHLNFTKLDVLDAFDTIKIAVAYHCTRQDGSTKVWRSYLPSDFKELEPEWCRVEYVEKEGWKSDISKCKTWNDLPPKAKEYVQFVEKEIGVRIKWIGVGAERDAMIVR